MIGDRIKETDYFTVFPTLFIILPSFIMVLRPIVFRKKRPLLKVSKSFAVSFFKTVIPICRPLVPQLANVQLAY